MGTLYEEQLADLAFMETEMVDADNALPVFIWKGNDYNCLPNTANRERDLEIGGFQFASDLILSVRTDQFNGGALPQSQDLIVYTGTTYRVLKVGQIAIGAYIRLHCVDKNRGV